MEKNRMCLDMLYLLHAHSREQNLVAIQLCRIAVTDHHSALLGGIAGGGFFCIAPNDRHISREGPEIQFLKRKKEQPLNSDSAVVLRQEQDKRRTFCLKFCFTDQEHSHSRTTRK